ncbi:uncharacterized protein T069G_11164 [Trichoderma breve]|uniref:Uncharacterized protein n=1 Tax=Trichoderma breve TaxID=2034170 RepID=A0A9W9B291_9HYPO|nr:uncharacterized protein T069G_11164 [Trichoderma breve]KAJ4854185.1 hypothetical protein T069G_11164 [Trichoderma breve]
MSVASHPKRVLKIERSQTENSTVLVYDQFLSQYYVFAIYAFKLYAFEQPFLELYHYPIANNILVGDAQSFLSTSEIRLTLSGKEYTLTIDADSNSFGLKGYNEGELRWVKSSHPGNLELELVDHTGRLLARLKECGWPERKMLEVYGECAENLLTLMLLSGLVVVDAIFQRIPLHGKGEPKVYLPHARKAPRD